jgi:hypothetical protein
MLTLECFVIIKRNIEISMIINYGKTEIRILILEDEEKLLFIKHNLYRQFYSDIKKKQINLLVNNIF